MSQELAATRSYKGSPTSRRNIIRAGCGKYKGYAILNKDFDKRNLISTYRIIEFCRDRMTAPIMAHYIVELAQWGDDLSEFEPDGFIRTFKRGFGQSIRKLNESRTPEKRTRKNIPDLHLFYSIESKYAKVSKTTTDDKDKDAIIDTPPVPFLHMHMMVIVDSHHARYGFTELNNAINDSLLSIKGVKKPEKPMNFGALKMRNSKTSIFADDADFSERRYHNLKAEFNDAICRASYLCKLDQKDLIPTRFKAQSFGRTKLQNHRSNDRASIELEAVTIAMIDAILNEGLRDTPQDTSSKLLRKIPRKTKHENQHHQIELDLK